MDDLIKSGFQQRVSDLEYIVKAALEALARIAAGDKYRIGKSNQAPYEYARDTLENLGVDLEVAEAYAETHLEQAMLHLGWPKDKK